MRATWLVLTGVIPGAETGPEKTEKIAGEDMSKMENGDP